MTALLFDIGGTTMRMAAGQVDPLEHIEKVPAPRTPGEAVEVLALYAKEVGLPFAKASGGIAGIISDGAVISSPHLPAWNGFAFAAELEKALGIPCEVRNDAELAGLGEAVYGAGKGFELVAYLGIGTGIGGALVSGGQVAPHAEGFEPGHQILDVETGATFEGLVSGHALERFFGTPARDLTREVYDGLTSTVAAGVYNVILTWSPGILVLGGSLINEENGYRVADIEKALHALPHVLPELPILVQAQLGDECGLYGALATQHVS
ncbi:MAG: ROK family protein [Patescibacteria group bacterium]